MTQNEKDNDDSSSSRSAQTEHVTQWTNALGERARDEEEEEKIRRDDACVPKANFTQIKMS